MTPSTISNPGQRRPPPTAARAAQAHFICQLVHAMRTPLTIVTLLSRHLETRVEVDEGQMLLKDLQKELGQVHETLNAASLLAQLNGRTGRPQRDPVNLARLARQEVERLERLANQKGQQVHYAGPSHLVVRGDEEQLRGLIRQLVHNAIQYTPEGGHIVCEWTSVRQADLGSEWPGSTQLSPDQKGWALLWVTDTGVGVSPEDLPHIFDRFYRGKASAQAGAGLGLALVQEVVRLHHGHIGVDSAAGAGSRFIIYLPLRRNST